MTSAPMGSPQKITTAAEEDSRSLCHEAIGDVGRAFNGR